MDSAWTYGILGIGMLVLVWMGYSAWNLATSQLPAGSAGSALPMQNAVPEECGDLNDPQNIQHLSHHPDRYQECYRFVDPQKFKEAVGRDINEFMG